MDFTTGWQVRGRWTNLSHRVWVSGELGSSDAAALAVLLSELLVGRCARLTVDLSELQFLGLRAAMVVIDAEHEFAAASKALRVGPLSPAAGRALTLGRQLRARASIAA